MLKFSTFQTRRAWRLRFSQNNVLMSTLFCENFSLQALLVQKLKISTLDGAKLRNCRGATAKTAGVHFLIFGYFCRLGYISAYRWARVQKPRRNIINLASKSPLNTTLAPLSPPLGPRDIETLVVSWGRPYQSNDYDMGSFADFRSVRACHTYAAVHVKLILEFK